jgi:hypothetical protein
LDSPVSKIVPYSEDERKRIRIFLSQQNLFNGLSFGNSNIKVPFEIGSEDFLSFAQDDLRKSTDQALINALSNIKRAIDCRIASVLYALGIYKKSKREQWDFPKSTDFLCKLGILAPNVLKQINRERNKLEHEFTKPTMNEVLVFLDVASLFLASTNYLLKDHYELELSPQDGSWPWVEIDLFPEKESIEVTYWSAHKEGKRFEIISNQEDYCYFLEVLVKAIKNQN